MANDTNGSGHGRRRLPLHWQITLAMVFGAALGLFLNWGWSHRSTRVHLTDDWFLVVEDSPDRIDIRITDRQGNVVHDERHGRVQPLRWIIEPGGPIPTLEELKDETFRLGGRQWRPFELFQTYGRSVARRIGDIGDMLGGLFLRLLRMVAVPLIITSLLTGVTGLGSAARLGRMFAGTITYYLTTSTLAVLTGLFFVNLIRPGIRPGVVAQGVGGKQVGGDLATVLFAQVEKLIPTNPVAAVADTDFLSIIAFTLAFGVFTILVGGRTAERIRELAHAGFEVMMAMTLAIIRLAPIGVFCLMLYATATQGIGVFRALGWYMVTVLCGLIVHGAVTLPLIVRFVAGRNPWRFAQAMSPALLTAFSSASSNATLPLTLTCAEERAGISNRVSSFVLPLGATINMDGTALYEVVAVLFIAQLDPNVTLTFTQQVMVVITALLASIGAAGIPHAGLVMMVIVLQAAGLPIDRVGIILAVDRVLDMFRTAINVWSDSCGTAVLARFDPGGEEAVIPAAAVPSPEG